MPLRLGDQGGAAYYYTAYYLLLTAYCLNLLHTTYFVSATKVALLTSVDATHWENWLTAPVQFAAALDLVAQRARGAPLCALQTGPHPVLDGAVAALGAMAGVQLVAQAASLHREAPALAFIRQQRAALAAAGALAPALRAALSRPGALQVTAGGFHALIPTLARLPCGIRALHELSSAPFSSPPPPPLPTPPTPIHPSPHAPSPTPHSPSPRAQALLRPSRSKQA